jgi:AraC family transcriptional regulator of adaptative response/methylated-DNA-[protein]-cysteine methyltransferase
MGFEGKRREHRKNRVAYQGLLPHLCIMTTTEHHYATIERAITYLNDHFKEQPSLDEVARHVHLSPHHFQRIFTKWAGVSPKKFLRFLSLEFAKDLLRASSGPLSEAAYATGLSGTGRLHDLFVNIEAMTPAEFRNGGEGLNIIYDLQESAFGTVFIASTEKGICHLRFVDDEGEALTELEHCFPNAHRTRGRAQIHDLAANAIGSMNEQPARLDLHLRGTPFQLKVWQALLDVPNGIRATYGQLAGAIGKPGASRAVGTAIGKNPVAMLIPCHRVIRSSGESGGYRWGPVRKQIILGRESAHAQTNAQ